MVVDKEGALHGFIATAAITSTSDSAHIAAVPSGESSARAPSCAVFRLLEG